MKFAIRNLPKANKSATQARFDSLEDARVALAKALGWPDAQLGPGYTAPDAEGQVWCAYRTHEEAEADPDGLKAPRIVRIFDADAEHEHEHAHEHA
jgi:hypothetical protein